MKTARQLLLADTSLTTFTRKKRRKILLRRTAMTTKELEWSLEPERSRSRILHFYAGAGAEPE